ncbi:unnamed protein product, partial [Rhizopus stolonifer]
ELIIEQVGIEGAIIKSEAARRYGQSTSTVRNILDVWHTEGRMENKERRDRREEISKFEDVHGKYIIKLLDVDCTKTLNVIKEKLEAEFPELAEKHISTSGLWRYITERIGLTLKRTKAVEERRNTPGAIMQCYEYVVHRLPERGIAYKTNRIFVDEAGFNANLVRGQ